MITNEELYEKIVAACKMAGIPIKQLEDDIGIAHASIGKWKKGKNPSWRSIGLIADYLNVSTDYLYGKVDDPRATVTLDIHNKMIELSNAAKLLESGMTAIAGLTKGPDRQKR